MLTHIVRHIRLSVAWCAEYLQTSLRFVNSVARRQSIGLYNFLLAAYVIFVDRPTLFCKTLQ